MLSWRRELAKVLTGLTNNVRVAIRILPMGALWCVIFFFFSSRRRHTRLQGDWSSDVCSSDLPVLLSGDHARIARWRRVQALWRTWRTRPELLDGAGLTPEEWTIVERFKRGEIGRASWRERGEISVGAGSLKKKKKRKMTERDG